MNLAITIPAYNEATMISTVIKNIPRDIPGIKNIKIVVIDDGSTDDTVMVAKNAGADIVLSNHKNIGLAKTFERGLDAALFLQADIIINIDSDGQHNPKEIPNLIQPILKNKSDFVIGNRKIKKQKDMKPGNYYGNLIGNFVIKILTKANISDASCGFRAMSRKTALKFNLFADHTYTHETIIQAAFKNLRISEVKIEYTKRKNGKSRLIKNLFNHIKHSSVIIVRTVLIYKSFKILFYIGAFIFSLGTLLGLRYAYLYFILNSLPGKLQSLLLSSTLLTIGFFIIILGFLSDLIAKNRDINEQILYLNKLRHYSKNNA
ncbi:MAG: glycosyltransferase family 2 protein [Patescibacteria group bacterium]|nr:glycosyltransferase family 2 protein [Patescibacteria group bacterium]